MIWGPGDPHLIPRLLERARSGRLAIVGGGENVVDLTYIDNAADAHLGALDALGRDDEPNPAGKAYFISNGEPVALWPWVHDLLERLEIRADPPARPASCCLRCRRRARGKLVRVPALWRARR